MAKNGPDAPGDHASDPGSERRISPPSKILIVDDEPTNIHLLSEVLSDAYDIFFATSGRQALQVAATRSIGLVILDVRMPEMDGFEVCRRLKADERTRSIPVIFVTAMGEVDQEALGFEVGGADYITKPISPPIVRARVRAHLELSEQRDFIRRTFGRYLSDDVVAALLHSPDRLALGGERRRVTILMSDLRGFTPIAERLHPEQVVKLLNNHLGTMTDVILDHDGTIDEFQGDSVLALFGAPIVRPDDARRAIRCALDMQAAMERVNALNRADGLPEVEMGIGVHTGDVVVGNVGSMRRTKYGVVGRDVNLTSRIESCTVGGQVLISDATLRDAGDGVQVGESVKVDAKGLSDPVVAHVLLDRDGSDRTPEEPLAPVIRRVDVAFDVLDGKRAGGEVFRGVLLSVSRTTAEVESPVLLEPLTNVRLRLVDAGDGVGDVYGKVMPARSSKGCRVRFTYVPPEVRDCLKSLVAG